MVLKNTFAFFVLLNLFFNINSFMKKRYFFILTVCLFYACTNTKDKIAQLKSEMMAAENAFSVLSEQQGTKQAMMEYIDTNGILLRPNSFPLVGANAIDFISQANDSSYKMVWQAKGGTVAASGDLGYTFGIFKITPKNNKTPIFGTYVNVWKKQINGSWKLLLDSGNEGVE